MKRKKFKFCDLPIKWQFFVGLLSVSVIPMLVFGMYMAMKTRETFLEESYRQMEENLAQATQNVDMVMEKYVNTSSLIYMNKEVQSLIAMDFSDYNYEEKLSLDSGDTIWRKIKSLYARSRRTHAL